MRDGRHFDRVAPAYGRGRPPYPTALYDVLVDEQVLVRGSRVLEVGAGSGQATVELLARGATVTAVEPGPTLAADLRARLPDPRLTVLESEVEQADLEPGWYDAVVAATSLHWVDLDRALPVLHRALRAGGRLAAWWTVFGDPDRTTPFRERVDEITHRGGIGDRSTPYALRREEVAADLERGGLFRVRSATVLPWSMTLTTRGVRDLFTTFPTWSEELVDEVAAAVESLGGAVEEHYLTAVHVADRL